PASPRYREGNTPLQQGRRQHPTASSMPLVTADVEAVAERPAHTLYIDRGGALRRAGVNGRAAGLEVIIVRRRVDEKLRRRGHERVLVLAGLGAPLRERHHRGS